jgi:hypothetical protein
MGNPTPLSCSVSPMLGRVRTNVRCANYCLFLNNLSLKKTEKICGGSQIYVWTFPVTVVREKPTLDLWGFTTKIVRTHPSRLYMESAKGTLLRTRAHRNDFLFVCLFHFYLRTEIFYDLSLAQTNDECWARES